MAQVRRSLIVISGPSGVGKGTLLKRVMAGNEKAVFSVSATTRAPRKGEMDGRDYFFVSEEEFSRMVEEGAFLEYAEVFGLARYGTMRKYVEEQLADGFDVYLDVDVQGALNVKKAMDEAVTIFVMPPSMEELERRLRRRGTESEESIKKRLLTSKKEMELANAYDYTIINDNVDDAVADILAIIGAEQAAWAAGNTGGND